MWVNIRIWRVSIVTLRLVFILFWLCDFSWFLWLLSIISIGVISFSSFVGSFLILRRIFPLPYIFSIVVMVLQLLIDIRPFRIPRKPLNELMLYLIQTILILFFPFLKIRIDAGHSHFYHFIQYPF